MNILINHCWCSDCNWGGHYDCRVIVTVNRVDDDKTYYDPPSPDWALVEPHKFASTNPHERETLRPRADVIEWLNANVKDRKLTAWHKERGQSPKGWAIGTDQYNAVKGISFSFFFERERDGMAFIKRWSVHKKPVSYLQYFKDIRKKLDPKTGKLVRVPR
jgi:hypothetical protein